LNHGAAADGAGVAVEEFFEVVVGADEDAAVFVGAALAADGDFGARSGLAGVARWVGVEALEKLGADVTWNDPVVGSWQGKDSVALGGADIAVVVTKHDVVSAAEILKSAPYVFDTTGKVKGAVQL
jgi:hypothetical protein